MTKWTLDNTDGFSQEDLDVINEASDIVRTACPNVDDSNINDALNNAWRDQITAQALADAARKLLGHAG